MTELLQQLEACVERGLLPVMEQDAVPQVLVQQMVHHFVQHAEAQQLPVGCWCDAQRYRR